jgi:hypothetical protein
MGQGTHTASLQVQHEKNTDCDQCLAGTWQIDLEQFATNVTRSLYADGETSFSLNSIGGAIELTFMESGAYQTTYHDFTMDSSMASGTFSGGSFATSIVMLLTGQVRGSYWLDTETGLLVMTPTLSTAVIQMRVGENSGAPRPMFAADGLPGDGTLYTCTANELIIHTTDENSQAMENRYVR